MKPPKNASKRQIIYAGSLKNLKTLKLNNCYINQTFFCKNIWSESHQDFNIIEFASWEIWYITWILAIYYLIPKKYGQWDSGHL